MDWAPNASFLVLNGALLLAIMALTAEVTACLGGGRAAQVASAVLLAFGSNFAGDLGRMVLPVDMIKSYPILGDPRYSPWIRKFGVFQQDPIGIAFCAGLAFLTCQMVTSGAEDRWRLGLTGLLLAGTAIFYPILWPAAALLAGGALLVLVWSGYRATDKRTLKAPAALAGLLLVGGLTLVGWMMILTTNRGNAPTMGFRTLYEMKLKAATAVVVLLPLWITSLMGARILWRERRAALLVLGVAVAGALGLNVAVDIYYWTNEYKYIFIAALCLAPVAAVGVGRVREALPRQSGPLFPAVGAAGVSFTVAAVVPAGDGQPSTVTVTE
jgi:hypothetical protein